MHVPVSLRQDVLALWDYHDLHHEPRPCDVGIGLGSHDQNVPLHTARLFLDGMFPRIVFSGANAETTRHRFPRGEAHHYRDLAISLGVPPGAIELEPEATNTSPNISLSRALLLSRGLTVTSVMLVCRPYQQRRAFATCRRVWPEVEVICSSAPLSLDDYVVSIGDARLVIDMLVGDTQRVAEYARRGSPFPITSLPQSRRPISGSSTRGSPLA